MAARQLGSAIAVRELAGSGEASVEEAAMKPYRRMGGGNDPVWDRVSWEGGAGTGGAATGAAAAAGEAAAAGGGRGRECRHGEAVVLLSVTQRLQGQPLSLGTQNRKPNRNNRNRNRNNRNRKKNRFLFGSWF